MQPMSGSSLPPFRRPPAPTTNRLPPEAQEALVSLKQAVVRHTAELRDPFGEVMSPEAAVASLATGSEVVARVPPRDPRERTQRRLLLSLDDAHELIERLM